MIMKGIYSTLIFFVVFTLNLIAQKGKKDDITGDYFLMKGRVFEVNMIESAESKASNVQVVVYQEKELYVAFFTNESGEYSFYLPIGHVYEVWFGGAAFVNKKVSIEAAHFPKEKRPRTIPLDMGLFRPVEGYDFPMLNEPMAHIKYDPELDQIGPDLDAIAAKSLEIEKYFKKIKKEESKKKK
jgi:hypothetical protein